MQEEGAERKKKRRKSEFLPGKKKYDHEFRDAGKRDRKKTARPSSTSAQSRRGDRARCSDPVPSSENSFIEAGRAEQSWKGNVAKLAGCIVFVQVVTAAGLAIAHFGLPARLSPEEKPDFGNDTLVTWHDGTPECHDIRYVVAKKAVKLRKGGMDSEVLRTIRPGAPVLRIGPCQNEHGLVRMYVAAYSKDVFRELWFSVDQPMASVCPEAMQLSKFEACVTGWTTLTAEFVNGPRFFEAVTD